jgi:hypothetical protein
MDTITHMSGWREMGNFTDESTNLFEYTSACEEHVAVEIEMTGLGSPVILKRTLCVWE